MAAEIEAAERDACADRPRLDAVVHRHALRDSHRPDEHRPHDSGSRVACRGRPRRHARSPCSITMLVINPLYLLWRGPTRWIERRVWRLASAASRERPRRAGSRRVTGAWLRWRLRFAIRMRAARYSMPAALNQGLQSGLPLAAIVAATVPVWGMSWYFDTENWAAGMWNSWAESRTDTWREAMVRAVLAGDGGAPGGVAASPSSRRASPRATSRSSSSATPARATRRNTCSAISCSSVANAPDVRFVVISSDVVYPTGAMKDYEAKFWLPFKGVTRPVYAIPGNHDWYDALEGFAATFLQADAARAEHSREGGGRSAGHQHDRRTASRSSIREAARLREAYGVPTGFQRAPFFEIQTDRFALVAIDTGILRTIDAAQAAWLEAALTRAAGKLTMAIVGPSVLRGRPRRHAGRRRVHTPQAAPAPPRRHHRHGRRHARSRVLRRAAAARQRAPCTTSSTAAAAPI